MIRAIDIGMEQIYQAAQDITDRETIIVFTSDNGATTRYRPFGNNSIEPRKSKLHSYIGCNYPLKGKKSSLNEAGYTLNSCAFSCYRLSATCHKGYIWSENATTINDLHYFRSTSGQTSDKKLPKKIFIAPKDAP